MPLQDQEKTSAHWMKEAQKGYIRVAVLILLNKKPSHGYEIMKEIRNRTKGFWKPTAGGVYPILRDLETEKYVEGEWQVQNKRKIKVYKITETGRQILRHAIIKQSEIANGMNSLFREFAENVLNMKTSSMPLPIMPSPFSPFLKEKTELENEDENVEQKRRHIKSAIKMLQKELQAIEKNKTPAKRAGKSEK
jgi:DNA-binding PadR family transcriptional regulator